jgi:replicative DNA helicase
VDKDRLPPHDIDAEEAVLGSLLIDGSAIHKVTDKLQVSDFYGERNLAVFEACIDLYGRNAAINQVTVGEALAQQGKQEVTGGAAYLSHLISVCPTALDIEDYANIVARLGLMRSLIKAAEQINEIGYRADPDVSTSLDQAEDLLYHLRHGQSSRDFVHIWKVLEKYLEAPSEDAGEKPALPFVPMDFTGLDELLGGLQRSDLIILAARPSMGKTSLALNIARNAAINHRANVGFFSLEMSMESMVLRLLSSEAEVNLKSLRDGILHHDNTGMTEEEKRRLKFEQQRITQATGVLSEANIFIDDSPFLRVVELRSKARRLYYELDEKLDLIIVDYLQLIGGESRNENRVQEISLISRTLKALARELNVPVLALSQLSRATEQRQTHRPMLSDLRESGSLEQDADVVMFVLREEVYFNGEEDWKLHYPERPYPPESEIIISKHRNGPIGSVMLRFRKTLAKFENSGSAAAGAREEPSYESV